MQLGRDILELFVFDELADQFPARIFPFLLILGLHLLVDGQQREIFEDKWSVSEKIELLARVIGSKPRVKFSELFEDATSRTEVVVTFLAMLELIRLKQIICVQTGPFADIEISKAEPPKQTVPVEIPDQAIFEDESARPVGAPTEGQA